MSNETAPRNYEEWLQSLIREIWPQDTLTYEITKRTEGFGYLGIVRCPVTSQDQFVRIIPAHTEKEAVAQFASMLKMEVGFVTAGFEPDSQE